MGCPLYKPKTMTERQTYECQTQQAIREIEKMIYTAFIKRKADTMLNNDTLRLITAHIAVSYGVWRSWGYGRSGDNRIWCRPGSCGVNYEGHIGPSVPLLLVTHT